jgi:hypothetical protein
MIERFDGDMFIFFLVVLVKLSNPAKSSFEEPSILSGEPPGITTTFFSNNLRSAILLDKKPANLSSYHLAVKYTDSSAPSIEKWNIIGAMETIRKHPIHYSYGENHLTWKKVVCKFGDRKKSILFLICD